MSLTAARHGSPEAAVVAHRPSLSELGQLFATTGGIVPSRRSARFHLGLLRCLLWSTAHIYFSLSASATAICPVGRTGPLETHITFECVAPTSITGLTHGARHDA